MYTANGGTVPLESGATNPAGIQEGDKLIKVTIGMPANSINQNVNEILHNGFYDIIKDKTFNEYLGEYQNGTQASSENRLTKRIITYVEISSSS